MFFLAALVCFAVFEPYHMRLSGGNRKALLAFKRGQVRHGLVVALQCLLEHFVFGFRIFAECFHLLLRLGDLLGARLFRGIRILLAPQLLLERAQLLLEFGDFLLSFAPGRLGVDGQQ